MTKTEIVLLCTFPFAYFKNHKDLYSLCKKYQSCNSCNWDIFENKTLLVTYENKKKKCNCPLIKIKAKCSIYHYINLK